MSLGILNQRFCGKPGLVLRLANFDPLPDSARGAYLAVGNFDGVHQGHQALIGRLRERADYAGVRAVALTFDPRPVDVLRPGVAPAALSWLERKVELLKQAGAHEVGIFQTGPWLLGLTAFEFFDRVICGQFEAQGLVEGPTFGFGRDRGGDARVLGAWCHEVGMEFQVVSPVEMDGELITTTRIRRALAAGDVASAERWLGRFHRIDGKVVRGEGRGAGLGFPTANLGKIRGEVPAHGVYAAWAISPKLHGRIPAAVHIGPNSTFGAVTATVEANLLDFSGDLYGQELELDFVRQLRGTQKFSDVDSLLKQIDADVRQTRHLLG